MELAGDLGIVDGLGLFHLVEHFAEFGIVEVKVLHHREHIEDGVGYIGDRRWVWCTG